MDIDRYFDAEWTAHAEAVAASRVALKEPFARLVQTCVTAIKGGGKIMFFGNGGSAGDAQHLATELTVRYMKDRPPIAAVSLVTDTSALTAIVNDIGLDHLFARQVRAIGRKGDIAFAISTSGKSPNIILALKTAKEMGIVPVGFSGKGGGDMVGLADPVLVVPAQATARIQEMHITLGQMLCGALEMELGLA